jgi:hypothetical protein
LQSYSTSSLIQLRAGAELERRRRGLTNASPLARYRLAPERYIVEQLGWTPWVGDAEHPGQSEIIAAYARALRQQLERQAYEAGTVAEADLVDWRPGERVMNTIRVEAGHTVGKTTLAAGLVSHFFDTFTPSIVYCFAPTHDQINDLLFKEIRKQRTGKGLPGRVLATPAITLAGNHFVKGRAANDAGGQGTERVHGQHEPHLMFVIDEAEGVPGFVYEAIRSMSSGGLVVVLMLANPRTRTSHFHRAAADASTVNFRISCIHHPNVLAGREVIPGAVRRDYVEAMIDNGSVRHCEVVSVHEPDNHTFELPWQPGVIYRPDPEFLFRVLGVAPANVSDNTLVPVGRYEAAKARTPVAHEPHIARLGVDAARYGKDYGTLYARWNGRVWRAAQFAQQDTGVYYRGVRDLARTLAAQGVTSLHVRIDGGGGFGGGVVDRLNEDVALADAFEDFRVLEVHFNSTPYDPEASYDLATEIYDHTAELLRWVALLDPPAALEADLCERTYKWVKARVDDIKRDVRKLTPKDDFKRVQKRSPDDGDGCALACAPDYVFQPPAEAPMVGGERPLLASMQRGFR